VSRTTALEHRLRAIWPGSVELHVGHLPRRRRGGATYLVLPSLRRPIIALPADDPAAARAILRDGEGQRAAQVPLRMLARAQQLGLLRHAPMARVWVSDPEASPLLRAVRQAVPDAGAIVIRLGRPRPGRTVVLQALATSDGRPLAFAKCAFGTRVSHLRQEQAHLHEVGPEPAPGVRAPRVLEFADHDGAGVLVLEAMVPADAGGGRGAPVPAMRNLARRSGTVVRPMATLPVLDAIRDAVDAVGDDEARGWLGTELERLVAERGRDAVETGEWHGDWVGWNMARDGGSVLLWDWEHRQTGVPVGLDHVHYLAQQLRLRAGTSPRVEDRWVLEATRALAEQWGVSGAAADATLRTYLLLVNVRFVADREDVSWSAPRDGWSRELLARLGARSA
jgi:hypothetical protein